ncbi:MAG: hypothetical protein JWM20_344 [Patescibacteria group bacterium]|nr:hypothetical protein [Patescibacteria group bacterium]
MGNMSRKNKNLSADKGQMESLLEAFLKWGMLIVVAILPLLYFPGRVASYITSKEFFFIGATALLAIVWIWLMVKESRYRLGKWNLIALAPLALFLASFTVSSLFGVDPRISFYGSIESGIGMIFLWSAFIYVCILASFVKVQGFQFIKRLLRAQLAGAVILTIATFFTDFAFNIHSQMLNRSLGGAMMGNALIAAAYLLMSVFFGIILFTLESKRGKWLTGVALILIIFSPLFFLDATVWVGENGIQFLVKNPLSFLGHARMATLSLYGGLFISLFMWLWLGAKKRWARILGVAGCILIVLSVGFATWQVFNPGSEVNGLFIQEAAKRPLDWNIAIKGYRERPLLGWGQETYQNVYLKHLDPEVFDADNGGEVYALHPHNATLEILSNGGIAGLITYVMFILGIIVTAIILYRKKIISAAFLASLVALLSSYLLQNQMVFDSVASYVLLFSIAGILAGLLGRSEQENPSKAMLAHYATAVIATGLLAVAWIAFAYLPARKVTEMKRIGDEPSNVRINNYRHLFHSAGSAIFKADPEFYTLTLANSYNSQRQYFYDHADARFVAEQEIAELQKQMDSIFDDEQSDFKFMLSGLQLANLHMFLKQAGSPEDFARAKKYFDRAAMLSPNHAQLYLAYAETMIDSQNISAARDLIQKSLSLNAKNREVWGNLYHFESQFGTVDAAKKAQSMIDHFEEYNTF